MNRQQRIDCDAWAAKFRAALVGQVVVIGETTTTIIGTYSDIPGGIIVDPKVDGFKSWNLSDTKGPTP